MGKPQFNFYLASRIRANSRLSLAILGLAMIAPVSTAKAQDQSIQQAALETEPALSTEPSVETGRVINLDSSFLSRETDAWYSDAAGHSPERQARFESCYFAAEAAYQAGVWDGGFGSDTDDVSAFEYGVSDFYAAQQKKPQLGKCMQRTSTCRGRNAWNYL